MSEIIISVDTTQADAAIEDTEMKTKAAAARMARVIRQAGQAGILLMQATGAAIDQTYVLYAESIAVGVETLLALRAGDFGPQTILLGIQVALMLRQAQQIRQKKSEAATQTGAAVQLLRMSTFRSG